MGRIFLLENSLISAGTHHFDLVECLALGARSLGYDVQIATNITFRPDTTSQLWKSARPTFSDSLYQPYSSLAGIRQMQRVSPLGPISEPKSQSLWGRWRSWTRVNREETKVERHVSRFAQECAAFFQTSCLAEGDHVVFTTVSDLELLGALRFLNESLDTRMATWNFVFHFCAFAGRPENYPAQLKALSGLRQQVQTGLEQLPFHQLRFFATTSALVEQYRRLGLPDVQEFNYPASTEFFDTSATSVRETSNHKPLRLVVAGAVRREKGQVVLLDELRRQSEIGAASEQRTQWVFQIPRRASWRKPKLQIPASVPAKAVELVPHPLPKAEYISLIKGSDAGVLLYDRERYFARCAGVLGEFLAAGKPVIVSAGCWLGDQLDAATQDHARKLLQEASVHEEIPASNMTWLSNNVPQAGGIWSYDGTGHPFEATFDVGSHIGGLVIEFEWHSPQIAGSHCQWDLILNGRPDGLSRVVAFAADRKKSHLFFPIPDGIVRCTLRLQNPYAATAQSVRNVSVYGLGPEVSNCPLGEVGISIAASEQLGLAVQELQRHFRHYQETAQNMSRLWKARCSPPASVTGLLSGSRKQIMTF